MTPTTEELERRDGVLRKLLSFIRDNQIVKLPAFDASKSTGGSLFALAELGEAGGDFSGTFNGYRYHFEGEEDLLHLFITRIDAAPLTVEEAQNIADLLYGPVPKALIWLKPGKFSQHFYVGHDELLKYLSY